MNRVLVVSYSLGGTTARVAQEIAESLGADLDEIKDVHERKGFLSYIQSGLESVAKGLPSIRVQRDPGEYDMVVLGAPVWTGSIASPMRSYLFAHGHKFKDMACFCTAGGRGGDAALSEMRALGGVPNAPTFFARQNDVLKGRHRRKLRGFIATLGRSAGISITAAA